jgi:hypothetical protein
MKIQTIKCPSCNDTIYSRARHDFRRCSCGEVAIDGGFDYIKISFKDKFPERSEIELDITKEDLYDDWNLSIDKYGLMALSTQTNS